MTIETAWLTNHTISEAYCPTEGSSWRHANQLEHDLTCGPCRDERDDQDEPQLVWCAPCDRAHEEPRHTYDMSAASLAKYEEADRLSEYLSF